MWLNYLFCLLDTWGSEGSGEGQFRFIYIGAPIGIAVDSKGNVLVTDSDNERIQKFAADGTFLAQWGSRGSEEGQSASPYDITVDSNGTVFVAGYANIQKFTTDGTFLGQWGSVGSEAGQFNSPSGIAIDGDGNVYVVDTRNHRIQKFTSDGEFLGWWGREG